MSEYLLASVLIVVAACVGALASSEVLCAANFLMSVQGQCLHVWPLIIALPVSLLFAIPVGLPVHYILKRLGLFRLWQYSLAGFTAALLPWSRFAEPFHSPRWNHYGGFDSFMFLSSGALAGAVYWFLCRRMRFIPVA